MEISLLFLGWSHWRRRGNDCKTIKDFYPGPCRLVGILPPCDLSFKVIDAGTFPDPVKASEDLQAFAKLNEARLYKLLKTCRDAQTDLKGLIKTSVWSLLPAYWLYLTHDVLTIEWISSKNRAAFQCHHSHHEYPSTPSLLSNHQPVIYTHTS